ncbi:hypothetical protein [Pseudonocardia sp.]|uniref:hypothetical protein n=1 Tax=Pseudonocardia sp. TaxID=60912 RepID=UPI003D122876
MAGGGEQRQVLALDRAVEGALQGLQVGHVEVAELAALVAVDALLGQQRRELAQHLARHSRLELDFRAGPGWLRAPPTHVRHGADGSTFLSHGGSRQGALSALVP